MFVSARFCSFLLVSARFYSFLLVSACFCSFLLVSARFCSLRILVIPNMSQNSSYMFRNFFFVFSFYTVKTQINVWRLLNFSGKNPIERKHGFSPPPPPPLLLGGTYTKNNSKITWGLTFLKFLGVPVASGGT